MAVQELDESSSHCEPRVLKPLTGGFWLALSANKTDAPARGCFLTPRERPAANAGAPLVLWKEQIF